MLKSSQPIGDDPNLWMALSLTYNFVRYSYIYISPCLHVMAREGFHHFHQTHGQMGCHRRMVKKPWGLVGLVAGFLTKDPRRWIPFLTSYRWSIYWVAWLWPSCFIHHHWPRSQRIHTSDVFCLFSVESLIGNRWIMIRLIDMVKSIVVDLHPLIDRKHWLGHDGARNWARFFFMGDIVGHPTRNLPENDQFQLFFFVCRFDREHQLKVDSNTM